MVWNLIFIRSVCLGGKWKLTLNCPWKGKKADKESEDLTDDFKLPGDSILKLERKTLLGQWIKQFENERNPEKLKQMLKKLKNDREFNWCRMRDSNSRPADYKSQVVILIYFLYIYTNAYVY